MLYKYIVTHEIEFSTGVSRFGNAFIFVSHYGHALSDYDNLYTEAKKYFPELTRDDVECARVQKSTWCEGYPVLRFSCEPDVVKEGWDNVDKLPF